MKTVILGKKIENVYEVSCNQKDTINENGGAIMVYVAKPTLIKTPQIKEWVEICSYEGEPRYNSSKEYWFPALASRNQINISEDETVAIEGEIFRADLNEMHLRTEKIIEELDIDKENAQIILSEHIRAFNSMMITSNEKLKSYCDIHKLSYEDTDAIELFTIVFPDEQYEIVDGVMKVKEKFNPIYVSSANDSWLNANTTTFHASTGYISY